MTTTVESIVFAIQDALGDLRGIRWPASTIVGFLKDGQQTIGSMRPDALTTEQEFTLVAGVKQTVPDTVQTLQDILRNAEGKKRAITQVQRNDLDAVDPEWASGVQRSAVEHFMVDARAPRVYEVYPPIKVGTKVIARATNYPAALSATTGNGLAYDTAAGNIGVADEFKPALIEYGLHRCWARSDEYGNPEKAAQHLAAFQSALGLDAQTKMAVKATINDPPAVTG